MIFLKIVSVSGCRKPLSFKTVYCIRLWCMMNHNSNQMINANPAMVNTSTGATNIRNIPQHSLIVTFLYSSNILSVLDRFWFLGSQNPWATGDITLIQHLISLSGTFRSLSMLDISDFSFLMPSYLSFKVENFSNPSFVQTFVPSSLVVSTASQSSDPGARMISFTEKIVVFFTCFSSCFWWSSNSLQAMTKNEELTKINTVWNHVFLNFRLIIHCRPIEEFKMDTFWWFPQIIPEFVFDIDLISSISY